MSNGVDSLVSFTSRSYMCHFSSWYWSQVGFVCLSVSLSVQIADQFKCPSRIPLRLVLYSYYIKYRHTHSGSLSLWQFSDSSHMLDSAAAVDDLNMTVVEELSKCLLHAINCIIALQFCVPRTYQQACQPQGKTDQKRRQTRYKWG